jgi:hypothetical protein
MSYDFLGICRLAAKTTGQTFNETARILTASIRSGALSEVALENLSNPEIQREIERHLANLPSELSQVAGRVLSELLEFGYVVSLRRAKTKPT